MDATKREERTPFTLAQIKELHDLLKRCYQDCEVELEEMSCPPDADE
jgi:REP element-mobilizing transposase RayT